MQQGPKYQRGANPDGILTWNRRLVRPLLSGFEAH